ncbi:MAG: Gfo/Idh/MocA family oxidoreductase [Phycisphaerae bacterium]|nr:Gfo/Idh/MocA family oxidoreductase [Phycisphaerae bacterium]
MSGDKLRFGLVGLGKFVEIAHLPCYYETAYSDHIELAGICDLSQARLDELAPRCPGAETYTDHKKMFAEAGIDAVVIVTPDHAHTRIVLDALDAGLDVVVEKPLCMLTTEAVDIVEKARKLGRLVVVDFHKRFDPVHLALRERVLGGHYGAVQTAYSWMQDEITVPCGGFFKSDLAAKSSPVWFLGVHFFDVMRFITGLEPIEVRATAYKDEVPAQGVDTYDAVKADFIMNNGASFTFVVSWNLPKGAPALTVQGMTLQCAKGHIALDTTDRGWRDLSSEGNRCINPNFLHRLGKNYRGYAVESPGEGLMEIIEHRKTPFSPKTHPDSFALNGLYATLMGQAVDASLAAGTTMRDGHALVGATININDFLTEQVGADRAKPFLISIE